jgi:hypothetical protein
VADKVYVPLAISERPNSPRIHGGLRVNGKVTSATACGLRGVWVVRATGPNAFDDINCPDCIAIRPRHPMFRLPFQNG